MRRAYLSSTLCLCVALVTTLTACGSAPRTAQPQGRANGPKHVDMLSGGAPDAPSIAAIVRRMSLPQKVGQLFVAAVPGTTASRGGDQLVRTYHLGGVIYFQANIQNANQVAALSNGLQRAAMAATPAIPLTIGTDQEGGVVSRLGAIVPAMPSEMAAGATRDPGLVGGTSQAIGRLLRPLGINLDYAPVADVNVNPANPVIGTRSFGSDTALVAGMTSAAIAGFHAGGVAAAAKHFPGHGDTNVDSHTGLPIIWHTLRQWQRIDAPPFEAAIRGDADMIMSAHIVVPALERSGDPATLSRAIITGLLRGKLGYRGVVTTDALQMAGVRLRYSNAQIAVRAILAGCDELLTPDSLSTAYGAVLAAARAGQIPMNRLDESVTRILTLKARRGLLASPYVSPAGWAPAAAAATAAAGRLADRSVTVVRNSGGLLPLRRGAAVYVAGPDAASLAAALEQAGLTTAGSVAAADAVVLTTRDAVDDPAQRALARGLLAAGHPVILVATGKPYDLGLFPGMAAGIATYSDAPVSIRAAAGVLTGALHPSGKLPVTVPGGYPFGTGLSY